MHQALKPSLPPLDPLITPGPYKARIYLTQHLIPIPLLFTTSYIPSPPLPLSLFLQKIINLDKTQNTIYYLSIHLSISIKKIKKLKFFSKVVYYITQASMKNR